MNSRSKRFLSMIAIIVASVAFGVIISADLGMMRKSNAQTAPIQTSSGAVATVTIPSFADIASRVAPAVVSITSTEVVKTADRRRGTGIDPFEFFFPDPQSGRGQRRPQGTTPGDGSDDDEHAQRSGGSGFIISPDGYILTNNHVVDGATKVDVHYGADSDGNGGHTVSAKIIGRDPATDIALLKIDAEGLPNVPLGDSDRIRKGDWAIAIGNPFQFENTLTVGVVSAKGRALGLSKETQSFENFIQTDAAINFGNSGGPLLNINGEVVGINTAIRGGGAQGLGFATPINTAKRILNQLKSGKVTRGYLGMGIVPVTDDVKAGFSLSEARGALVQTVEDGKPASKAGIKPGDVIVEVDSHKVNTNRDLIDYISYLPVGAKVNVTVIRDGGRRTLTATTAERNEVAENNTTKDTPDAGQPARNKLGMSVQSLTPQLRQTYGVDDNLHGVVVTSVKEVSPAGEALSEGDVISEVAGQKINSVEDFRAAIDKTHSGQTIRVYVTSPGRQSISGYRFIKVP